MKKFYLILLSVVAFAATALFPGNRVAALILTIVLLFPFVPKLLLFAIKTDEKNYAAYRRKMIQKRAKEKRERNERLDNICRKVPQERLL